MSTSKPSDSIADQMSPSDLSGTTPSKQHAIGEGSAIEKSGGPSQSGDPDAYRGTTSGTAEGKEADIDEALEQQRQETRKPR